MEKRKQNENTPEQERHTRHGMYMRPNEPNIMIPPRKKISRHRNRTNYDGMDGRSAANTTKRKKRTSEHAMSRKRRRLVVETETKSNKKELSYTRKPTPEKHHSQIAIMRPIYPMNFYRARNLT